MRLSEFIKLIPGGEPTVTVIITTLLLSLVQISPIKIEPWSVILKFFSFFPKYIGKFFFAPITSEMKKLQTKIDETDTSITKEVAEIKTNLSSLSNDLSQLKNETDTSITKEVSEIKTNLSSLSNDISQLKNETVEIREDTKRREAIQRRTRFVRFADEIRCNQNHSSDHYHAILLDITEYENYCSSHPKFKNEIANESIHLIRDTYHYHNIHHSFLEFTVNTDNK